MTQQMHRTPEPTPGPDAARSALSGLRSWWTRRHEHPPPADHTGARPAFAEASGQHGPDAPEPPAERTLWRMRTTVRDVPGALAALCTALAHRGVDILSLQTHPLAEGTVDEFLLTAPADLTVSGLSDAAAAAGGTDTWVERADAHDLADAPTRVLSLATRTALDGAELPLALRQLLGRCTIRSVPGRPAGAQDSLDGTVLRLRTGRDGALVVERPHLPFTPTEFARARALVELDTRLGPRLPAHRRTLAPVPSGTVTVGPAGPEDIPAAKEMHARCSAGTLGRRYHGPAGDADRYLDHLLSPRYGRTLAARTAHAGEPDRVVALGHLLWDGDETEVALLVEDGWQRRGIGRELLGRLVAMAAEAGSQSVYAVTESANTGMLAAMCGLGLPLNYQVEEDTLVITAHLGATPVSVPEPHELAWRQGELSAQD